MKIRCLICQSWLERDHSQRRYCSPECAREGARKSWREYGARNRDARRSYHRDLYRREPGKVAARVKRYRRTDTGKAVARRSEARMRAKHPEKYAARQAVLVAVRSGRLVPRPCQRCRSGNAQAHHPDYSKPLEVEWLCQPCHRSEHRRQA